jgi:integrase
MLKRDTEYRSVLGPYFKRYLEMKASIGRTSLQPYYILREFDDFAVEYGLKDPHITENFINAWRKSCHKSGERSMYMKNCVWSQVTAMMNRNGCSCFVPRIPKCPQSNFTPYIFSHEEIAAIFNFADSMRVSQGYMSNHLFSVPIILRTLYATGARIGELIAVNNGDFVWKCRYIHLKKTKNGHERILPMSNTLYDALIAYCRYRDILPVKGINDHDAPFFVSPNGIRVTADSIRKTFRKILEGIGIPSLGQSKGPRLHDIRHTFAVHSLINMSRKGLDLYVSLPILSAFLGHRSIEATEKYVRLTKIVYPELLIKSGAVASQIFPSYEN